MAEETTNPFASILGALQSKGGERGVVKDNEGKVSPHLTPSEVARYEKIFGIMKKVVAPGPEAGKVDRGGGGAAAKVGNTAAMQKIKSSGGGLPGVGDILGLAAAAGIIGAAFTTMSEDFVKRVKEFGQEIIDFGDATGDEFGKLAGIAAKVGGKLGLKVGLKSLKMVPFLGSLVNFAYAFDHFKKEEYFDGAWELVSGIAGLIPGAGTIVSMLMDGVKIFGEIEANKQQKETGEKPSFANVLGQQAEKLALFISDAIMDGKVPILSTMWKFGEGIGYFIKGDWAKGAEAWTHILPSLLGGKESPLYKSVAGGLNTLWGLAKETNPGAFDKAEELAGDAWNFIVPLFEQIGEVLLSFFNGIKNWLSDTINKGEKAINDATGLEVFATEENQGKTSAVANAGKASALAAIPGGQLAFKAWDYIMNDGMISKNGQVTRFDDQDDLLAAKKNGPIDKMLDGNSKIMKSIAAINEQQLNVLVEIRDGIRSLSSGGISFNNNSLTEEFYAQ